MKKESFGQFIKTAKLNIGTTIIDILPLEKANEAYDFYMSVPTEKLASQLDSLYEVITPGYDKICLDMITAAVIEDNKIEKTAGLKNIASTAYNKSINALTGPAAAAVTTALIVGPTLYDYGSSAVDWVKDKVTGRATPMPQEDITYAEDDDYPSEEKYASMGLEKNAFGTGAGAAINKGIGIIQKLKDSKIGETFTKYKNKANDWMERNPKYVNGAKSAAGHANSILMMDMMTGGHLSGKLFGPSKKQQLQDTVDSMHMQDKATAIYEKQKARRARNDFRARDYAGLNN